MAAEPSIDEGTDSSSGDEEEDDPLEGHASTQEKVRGERKPKGADEKGNYTQKHAHRLLTYDSPDTKHIHEMLCTNIK